ncbi:MAG: ATP-binding protein [Desulfobacterales bacterium]|nr:ATP-binding protein [Desulfobacterales bacterium]
MLDADRLNQVLLNLFLNGVEAMDRGGVLTVRADEAADGRRLEIRVSDTGGGIRPEDLSHIFEPYFTTKPGGTGPGSGHRPQHHRSHGRGDRACRALPAPAPPSR